MALSNICRYNGQIRTFYSVAQHACLVSDLVRPTLAFPALNHDDAEAYVGDMSSKLKHSPGLEWFCAIEKAWEVAIEIALGLRSLTPEERHEIKVADDLAAIFERVCLRYGRDFQASYDIDKAVEEHWISARSKASEMKAMAHRLPKYLTFMNQDMARAQFSVRFARYAVQWRGASEGVLIRVAHDL